jgi:hypothetical protein
MTLPIVSLAGETDKLAPIAPNAESATMNETSTSMPAPATDNAGMPAAQQAVAPEASADSTSMHSAENLHRALLTSEVVNREPVDELTSVPADIGQVFFFTEVRAMNGKSITHRWERNGEVMAEVNFNIGGDRWRVYSRKNIKPDWTGQWTVTVTDDQGQELSQQAFTVNAAAAADTGREMQ